MSLLEQDIIKKDRVEIAIRLDKSNNKQYNIEVICDNEVYTKEFDSSHFLSLYDLVSWKSYWEEENAKK